jgi:hypothetical protein
MKRFDQILKEFLQKNFVFHKYTKIFLDLKLEMDVCEEENALK